MSRRVHSSSLRAKTWSDSLALSQLTDPSSLKVRIEPLEPLDLLQACSGAPAAESAIAASCAAAQWSTTVKQKCFFKEICAAARYSSSFC